VTTCGEALVGGSNASASGGNKYNYCDRVGEIDRPSCDPSLPPAIDIDSSAKLDGARSMGGEMASLFGDIQREALDAIHAPHDSRFGSATAGSNRS